MASKALAVACVAVLTAGGSALFASRSPAQSTAPQRAASESPATALVMGRVVEGLSDRAVSGAVVIVSLTPAPGSVPAPPLPPGATSPNMPVPLATGPDGVFVIRNMPKGEYTFRAQAPGFLPGIGLESRRPGGAGHSLTVGEGARINNVVIRIWKFGVISGRLREANGDAFEGGPIMAYRLEPGARRRLQLYTTATTDDRGAFRLPGLNPGDYIVCAVFARHMVPIAAGVSVQKAAAAGPQAMSELNQTTMASGAPPITGSSGYRIGDNLLTSSANGRNLDPSPRDDGRMFVYTNACTGGVDVVSAASPITVTSGEEQTGLDLVTRLVPTLRVSGTVSGPRGQMGHVGVHLLPSGADAGATELQLKSASTVTDPAGAFTFVGVVPGAYTVKVTMGAPGQSDMFMAIDPFGAEFAAAPRPAAPTLPAAPTVFGSQGLTVTDSDVTGIAVALQEAGRITGRVEFEGTAARPTPDQLSRTRIDIRPVGGPAPEYFAIPRGIIDANAQIKTTGIIPGRYLVTAGGLPPGWFLKSLVIEGRDASAQPLDMQTSDLPGAVMTLTDKPLSLTGVVRDATGTPDTHATVLVFPADRSRWSDLPASGRAARSVRVAKTGSYTIGDLAAGRYLIVAVDDRLTLNWNDPSRLEVWSRSAAPVLVGEDGGRTMDLRTSIVR